MRAVPATALHRRKMRATRPWVGICRVRPSKSFSLPPPLSISALATLTIFTAIYSQCKSVRYCSKGPFVPGSPTLLPARWTGSG